MKYQCCNECGWEHPIEPKEEFNEDWLIQCPECGAATQEDKLQELLDECEGTDMTLESDLDKFMGIGRDADDAVEALVDELSSYGDLEEALDELLGGDE